MKGHKNSNDTLSHVARRLERPQGLGRSLDAAGTARSTMDIPGAIDIRKTTYLRVSVIRTERSEMLLEMGGSCYDHRDCVRGNVVSESTSVDHMRWRSFCREKWTLDDDPLEED